MSAPTRLAFRGRAPLAGVPRVTRPPGRTPIPLARFSKDQRTMFNKLNDLSLRLAAVFTTGVLLSDTASAQNMQTFTDNVETAIKEVPGLMSVGAYVAGAGLGMAGIFKLKQHVDSPQQVPMKDGLMRLGAGGALIALPFMISVATNSLAAGNSGNMRINTIPVN